ncbi:glycosyltransferase family 2 protein [Tepidiforma sp.]|uniref:glycosyltransferase family 2 protein n=1 Tax=Tepidiforma sp. TaxID=2682230 RepID=UPI0026259AF4|nr:glycosyltransferase family 2 protein [Tepidiforma sp.]MCX7616386.1 glycosyltransferase [Tepidiforma sp.]
MARAAARAFRDDRGVLVYLAAVVANTCWNLSRVIDLRPGDRPVRWLPRIAVLVPARNEAANIEACAASLLAQDWPDLRVIVLDDGSTDGTGEILRKLQREDGRLEVLSGEPPPPGWMGKPWACAQLAAAAGDADLLLFADADTRHAPGMAAAVAAAMERGGLAMLSAVPGQDLGSAAERWLVPLIPWALTTHLSPAAAQTFGFAPAAGAVGQVLAFRAEAYRKLSGHAAVRAEAAEDMAFARLATRTGLRWRVAAGWRVSRCRMYRGSGEAFAGLEKNLYPAMGGRALPFVFAWAWLVRAFAWPAAAGAAALLRGRPRRAAAPALELALGALTWHLVARRFGLPWRLAFEGPLAAAAGAWAAARSLRAWRAGTAAWKGRRLVS